MRAIRYAALAVVLIQWPGLSARAETLLERGTYLMRSIVACGNCHTEQTPEGPAPGMELAGGNKVETTWFTVYSSNITPDPETGIGKWSDAEIIAAIREGRRTDGSIIGPPMPISQYRDMSDRDVNAIVAYLRAAKPIRNPIPRSVYRFPLPRRYGGPVEGVAEPDRNDRVAYGAYLAGPLGHCTGCHTPFRRFRPDFKNRLGAGGLPFIGPWGTTVSANITPHPEDGIGRYGDAEVITMITEGVRPDGSRLRPPMGYRYYKNMNAADLAAIVAYLRTLKPLPSE